MTADFDFADHLAEEFEALHTNWQGWTGRNFWQSGSTLYTLVTAILCAQSIWPPNDPRRHILIPNAWQMIGDCQRLFVETYKSDKSKGFDTRKGANWWDDYGWWGISFIDLYDHYDAVFGSDGAPDPGTECYEDDHLLTKECVFQYAHDCWQVMQSYAWVSANKQYDGPAQPVEGGCWNSYFKPKGNGGIQNTVTNALYLCLSIRLGRCVPVLDYPYLDAITEQLRWFSEWFDLENARYEYPSSDASSRLVYDRPTAADSEYNKVGVPKYYTGEPGQMWSGDQGLLVAAFADILKAGGILGQLPASTKAEAEGIKKGLSQGARDFLTSSDGVFHEAVLHGDAATTFGVDYAPTGKGVLIRYLAYALDVLPKGISDTITTNAIAVCENPPDPNKNNYGLIWDGTIPAGGTEIGTNEAQIVVGKRGDMNRWTNALRTSRLDAICAAISAAQN
ncbi:MAG: hypothetical protein GY791_08395 [Alphaproteobacteria bacterium]|nr:hypothetical protein [Alphaproteobacteria bacterium]